MNIKFLIIVISLLTIIYLIIKNKNQEKMVKNIKKKIKNIEKSHINCVEDNSNNKNNDPDYKGYNINYDIDFDENKKETNKIKDLVNKYGKYDIMDDNFVKWEQDEIKLKPFKKIIYDIKKDKIMVEYIINIRPNYRKNVQIFNKTSTYNYPSLHLCEDTMEDIVVKLWLIKEYTQGSLNLDEMVSMSKNLLNEITKSDPIKDKYNQLLKKLEED